MTGSIAESTYCSYKIPKIVRPALTFFVTHNPLGSSEASNLARSRNNRSGMSIVNDVDGGERKKPSKSSARQPPIMIFILLASCLVLAMILHEAGHFVLARRFGIKTPEVGFGIGPCVLNFRFRELRLSLRLIPIGSFVRLDGLEQCTVAQQLFVHLGGVTLNAIAAIVTYGTVFSWMNLLLAAGNLLPLYHHDGWKCGVVIMRALLRRKSQHIERAFTFSGGFLSVAIIFAIIRTLI